MKVDFKFEIDDRICTPLNGIGIVNMQGRDDGGIKYFIHTKDRSLWLAEKDVCYPSYRIKKSID